ncbi:ATP-dependent sacrificial sulfur transferase LarE [Anaerostipes sp.]|uniref:ATP-dependent sacrificial sulfur transferase LarE n=1 Tax=Anaerostipes sp. TaxID=1872530 RepID=UPI0025C09879|nr:ATP-dependent sacrificial sulfur transferase LarE [Anaerostipes sp.]MBS7009243.1 ATP-dependent sacrificial sulfur transferase LarE [Anaerostipes sp.]
MDRYRERCSRLEELIKEYTKKDVMLAFSGGVDSSLLLKLLCRAAQESGKRVEAVTMDTELHPSQDARTARRVAEEAGAVHRVIRVDELSNAGILDNPENRCYLCKKHLFSELLRTAEKEGICTVLEGTNADDLNVYRPGIKAVKELGIQSPLAAAGMTKTDIRKLALEYGISVADRPASPCLATRFPYGTRLSREKMQMADEAEKSLRKMGFYNVRVRVHEETARIEVDDRDLSSLLKNRKAVVSRLKELGFTYITADLEGFRSGSMDVNLKQGKEI